MEEAKADFEELVRLAPGEVDLAAYHLNMGSVCYALEEYEEAIAHYLWFLDLSGDREGDEELREEVEDLIEDIEEKLGISP